MRLFGTLLVALILSSCGQELDKSASDNNQSVKEYSIEEFYKNLKVIGGVFNDDETSLLIGSNESGIMNLYEIDLKTKERKQLTYSATESFYPLTYVPGTDNILYNADKGGNEIRHIFLLGSDGNSRDLTPVEHEKASFAGWSKDLKSIYYQSTKRDPRFFDLYKMPTDTWEAEMIYENTGAHNIGKISYDENYISLSKSITKSENQLYLLDKSSGEMIEISIPEEKGSYKVSGFNNEGTELYYTTNANSEFNSLWSYNIENGERENIYTADWDITGSYLSYNEKYRVVSINEDGKNNLVILDAKTGKTVNFPDMPDGDILAVRIAKSENKMRLSVGTSKSPHNIYTYDFESQELEKITETLNPNIDADDLVSAEVIRFASFDSTSIPSIYYKPKNASPENKVPAVLFIHGGPGGQSRVGYSAFIQYLVNHGYAVLAVNNRGSSGYGKTFYQMDDRNHGDKDLKDCIWAKKWLQTQDYIDADKIGIIGGSYGGFMVMAAMTFAPDEFNVGVNIFGVTNWIRTIRSIPPEWEAAREALYKEMGDPSTDDSVRLYNMSPLFHADKVKNPVMVLQGANDRRVLQIESDEMVAAMKANNVPVEYILFPDEGHGFVKKTNQIKAYGDILKFLDKYLSGEEEYKSTPAS